MVNLTISMIFPIYYVSKNFRRFLIIFAAILLFFLPTPSLTQVKRDPLVVPAPTVEAAPGVVWSSDEDYNPRIFSGRTSIADDVIEEADALTNSTVLGNFSDAFTSGSNVAYQMLKSIGDTAGSGPVDPSWGKDRAVAWIDAQGSAIPLDQRWRYLSANNEQHAELIFNRAMHNQKLQRELELRSGLSPQIAVWLAHLLDFALVIIVLFYMKVLWSVSRAIMFGVRKQ